jgi:hypothetical protein
MEEKGIRQYTFELSVKDPHARLADMTVELIRNLDKQGGKLWGIEVH